MSQVGQQSPGLLVSVRTAAEAESALAGGATLIDVKEPLRGALGRADDATIAAVVRAVAGRCPVSAALGELVEETPLPFVPGLAFVKWGLAGVKADWRRTLLARAAQLTAGQAVAVAYADWQRAAAPLPEAVVAFAVEQAWGAFLLDTWRKDGRTLLDWLPPKRIADLCRACADRGSAGRAGRLARRGTNPSAAAAGPRLVCRARSGLRRGARIDGGSGAHAPPGAVAGAATGTDLLSRKRRTIASAVFYALLC